MKIMHIITGLDTGGAETMLHKLLSSTDLKEFQPVVVSLKSKGTLGGPIETLGIPVYYLRIEKTLWKGLSGLWRLITLVREIQPDLIQGWMGHANFAAALIQPFLAKRAPIIWNIRHAIYDLSYESRNTAFLIKLCAWISNRPARIIYNSETAARQHEAIRYKTRKTLVIPNGFDTKKFSPSLEARTTLRQELNLEPDAFLIGLVARFHPMKDHDTFIKAAAALAETGHTPHFILSGKGVDDQNLHLVRLIQSHPLSTHFHLLGERTDVSTLTAGLDISTISSYTESFPNVIGEAMACGVPCAVTDVGDSATLVGDTGKIIPPRNPAALARAWQELMEMDPETRGELGHKARTRIQKCYNLGTIIQKYEDLYKGLHKSQTNS